MHRVHLINAECCYPSKKKRMCGAAAMCSHRLFILNTLYTLIILAFLLVLI